MSFGAIIIGCVTGFVSAFFGIGGSSIDTPLLRTFLHLPPFIALGSPLPTALLTVAIALATYWKKHLVDRRIFIWSAAGGLPGITLGAYLSQKFSGQFLMLLTAVVLFCVGLDFVSKIFIRHKKLKKPEKDKIIQAPVVVTASFFVSILSGMLAIGGGLFFIPIYVLFFGMDIKKAIATSLSVIAVIILPSCLVHYQLGHIDLGMAASLGIGVIPMAYLGAKLDMGTDSGTIQSLFGILLILFSIYFFISQMMG